MGFRPIQLVNHATVVQTDTAFSPAQIWIDTNGKIILSWSNSTNSSIVRVAQDFIYMTNN